MNLPGLARAASLLAAALLLSACVEIDWHRTGQLWLGSLCDGVSQCSYDGDGDPYTRW